MRTVFVNANLIDGESDTLIENAFLIIEEDMIVATGQGGVELKSEDVVIDLKNQYMLPGLIDCHVHLMWDGSVDPQAKINQMTQEAITLQAYKHSLDYLNLGITAVRDVASPNRTVLTVRDAINAQQLTGPSIIASGPAVTMTGGHVHYVGREADGHDGVMKATRQLLKEKVDLIKIMATGGIYTQGEEPGSPQLTLEEVTVAVQEAHKKNKKVAAHAEGLIGIQNCIEAGVDTIEHGIYADEKALQDMKAKGITLVPTMIVMKQLATDERMLPWALEKAKKVVGPHQKMLERAIEIGVKIATGTDCGSPVTPPEYYFDELIIMNQAGMSPMDVIKASTSYAAEVIDLPNRGVLKEGYKADLLVCSENPLVNLEILKKDKLVYKNGLKIS